MRAVLVAASVAALVLALGALPGGAQTQEQENTIEIKRRSPEPGGHLQGKKVRVTFSEPVHPDTTITVRACTRPNQRTKRVSGETTVNGKFASTQIDKRFFAYHQVTVRWAPPEDAEAPPEDAEASPSPSPSPTDEEGAGDDTEPQWKTATYRIHVVGPNRCRKKGDGNPPNNPPNNGGDKQTSWGSTGHKGHVSASGSPSHHGSSGSTTTNHSDHDTTTGTSSSTFNSSTFGSSSTSSGTTDHSDHRSSSGTSFDSFDDRDSGTRFSTTPDSPLSDPTATPFDTEQPEVAQPEDATSDELPFSASGTGEPEPESGTLVVALAAALLLGVCGGLFLRKADAAPPR